MLNIRPAVIDDVPLILQLIRELAEYEGSAGGCGGGGGSSPRRILGKSKVSRSYRGVGRRTRRICSIFLSLLHLARAAHTVSGRCFCATPVSGEGNWKGIAGPTRIHRSQRRLRAL